MHAAEWTFLGKVPYGRALEIQYACAREAARGAPPKLLFLEHPPTVTLGRQADRANLKLEEEEFERKGIELFQVLRGGDVTYHGPGQLIVYPVVSLDTVGCSVPEWVTGHGMAIVRFLSSHGIESVWSEEHPGVWVGNEKIAAVGFHLSRRVSTHGLALNLKPDLAQFDHIVPCGLEGFGVTSMEKLNVSVPSLEAAAGEIAFLLADVFGWSLSPVTPNRYLLDTISHSR